MVRDFTKFFLSPCIKNSYLQLSAMFRCDRRRIQQLWSLFYANDRPRKRVYSLHPPLKIARIKMETRWSPLYSIVGPSETCCLILFKDLTMHTDIIIASAFPASSNGINLYCLDLPQRVFFSRPSNTLFSWCHPLPSYIANSFAQRTFPLPPAYLRCLPPVSLMADRHFDCIVSSNRTRPGIGTYTRRLPHL